MGNQNYKTAVKDITDTYLNFAQNKNKEGSTIPVFNKTATYNPWVVQYTPGMKVIKL